MGGEGPSRGPLKGTWVMLEPATASIARPIDNHAQVGHPPHLLHEQHTSRAEVPHVSLVLQQLHPPGVGNVPWLLHPSPWILKLLILTCHHRTSGLTGISWSQPTVLHLLTLLMPPRRGQLTQGLQVLGEDLFSKEPE